MRRRQQSPRLWAVPSVRPLASENAVKARTGAQPRLTSGGRAASSELKALFGQSQHRTLVKRQFPKHPGLLDPARYSIFIRTHENPTRQSGVPRHVLELSLCATFRRQALGISTPRVDDGIEPFAEFNRAPPGRYERRATKDLTIRVGRHGVHHRHAGAKRVAA